jgi:drug/metabolite transporter (DMT)-like permease
MQALRRPGYFQLHFSVFLFGFTGILGELIPLSSLQLIWWRMGLASVGFVALALYAHLPTRLAPLQALKLAGIGSILGVHWIFFFEAIKQANVSIALTCVATAPLMTAILEPFLTRRRLALYEFFLAGLAVVGIYLIFNVDLAHFSRGELIRGVLFALIAAFLSALYGVLNKITVHAYDTRVINLYEIGGGWLLLSVFLALYGLADTGTTYHLPQGWSWLWLALLAFACTNWAYILSLSALNHVTAFAYVLAINMEPIYAILLAFAIFREHEELNWQFAAGALLVLSSVFLYPMIRIRRRQQGKAPAS